MQIVAGTWSRVVNRSLATVRDGPSAVSYTPSVEFTTGRMPAFTMRELGSRAGIAAPGAANTPGPLAYHPSVKSRFGGGQFGDSPRYSLGKKDEVCGTLRRAAHRVAPRGGHCAARALCQVARRGLCRTASVRVVIACASVKDGHGVPPLTSRTRPRTRGRQKCMACNLGTA